MGILRLLLAASVVAFHSGPIFGFRGMGADAVQAFFILSGLYMALIVSVNYANATDFYLSRALRLFPVYWVFLLMVVAIAALPNLGGGDFLQGVVDAARGRLKAATDGSAAAWLTAIPNLLMIGSDWARQFFSDDAGALHVWRPEFREGPGVNAVERHLIAPQIWSLGVELAFYAGAPFLMRLSTRLLIAIGVVAYIAGNVAQGVGETYTGPFAWRHMLPMQNAWLFVLGVLCFRALPAVQRLPTPVNAALAAVPFVLVFVWAPTNWQQLNGLLLVFALGLPPLFTLTKDWRADRWVGELAYPIYLVHLLFAYPALVFGAMHGPVCFLVSVIVSIGLAVAVQAPVDRYRHSLINRARPRFAG